jgi:hypothetical protein
MRDVIRFMPRSLLNLAELSICMLLLTSCSSTAGTATIETPAADMWAVAWGASPESSAASGENPGGAEQTFRSFFYPTVAGTMERVRFSNYFGTAPIVIGAARLAIAATPPAVDAANDVALSFGGSPSITIAPGTEVMSDAVTLTYPFGQEMAVTAYVQGTFRRSLSTIPR